MAAAKDHPKVLIGVVKYGMEKRVSKPPALRAVSWLLVSLSKKTLTSWSFFRASGDDGGAKIMPRWLTGFSVGVPKRWSPMLTPNTSANQFML